MSRDLSIGMTGKDVELLQMLLNHHLGDRRVPLAGDILSLLAAASHPDIKPQIDFITASKEKLKLAQAEELAHRKVCQEQLAELAQTAKQRGGAHRERMEELKTPSPPLDGDALGRALLKNLGLTD